MYEGNTSVVTSGAEGAKRLVYSVVYVDGNWSGRTLLTAKVVRQPRTEVERVGTKQRPAVTRRRRRRRRPHRSRRAVKLGRRRGLRVGRRLVDQHR